MPITLEDVLEKKERDKRRKMERIKAKFTARALSLNTVKGAETDDVH